MYEESWDGWEVRKGKDTGIQEYRDTRVQGCDTEIQGCDTGIQGCLGYYTVTHGSTCVLSMPRDCGLLLNRQCAVRVMLRPFGFVEI